MVKSSSVVFMLFLALSELQLASAVIQQHSTWGSRRPNKKNLLMCITGQLRRLELETKIKNYVEVNQAMGHSVDIIAILDNTAKPRSVNFAHNSSFSSASSASFTTIREVRAKLQPLVNNLRIKSFSQPAEPVVPAWYGDFVRAKSFVTSSERVQMHVRQLTSIEHCYYEMIDLEFHKGRRYDMVLRIRDDGYIMKPIKPLNVGHRSSSEEVLVVANECDSWGGVNDKALLVDRMAAKVAFTHPLRALYVDREGTLSEGRNYNNPETLMAGIFEKAGIKVVQDFDLVAVSSLRSGMYEGVERCLELCKFGGCW
eukprot:CAMPEP_0185265826 /NCGR_PEP_ID=MMETSP1359-20130426/28930_1 /TAXON_ID=552665 /ORGANISM="Bigelowiella longifila, Strain CCMP242" /LENGTH=312 /DNA_ID=CAMNT_0027855325 /DNA_START=17 /DNA_END=952 /DNA_ORIENTATION=-